MEIRSLTRYARISPKKAREVARTIQGLPAHKALEKLEFVSRKAARLLSKTLKSAIANAENHYNLAADELLIERAIIEQGPSMKRWRAGARGQAKPRRKRMSHIEITLAPLEIKA